jgi:murein DD-endopeptidase MepM/ murein hydrolase activator NlpD
MGIVGLLTVGMTTPADAVAAPGGNDISASLVAAGDVAIDEDEIQAYVAPSEIENADLERSENYSSVTMAEMASESGIANFSNFFVNDPNSPIQWPFAVGVPISYGFGMRDGAMHEGADFTPGEGSPIQAIADGVVRESTDSGGAFGVHIVIDHIIDGELVSSSYSHMLYGSRQVEVGDQVTVGTVIGHTGNTGRSFGAHTHFEILANGTDPIDPIPWLREHAGG